MHVCAAFVVVVIIINNSKSVALWSSAVCNVTISTLAGCCLATTSLVHAKRSVVVCI